MPPPIRVDLDDPNLGAKVLLDLQSPGTGRVSSMGWREAGGRGTGAGRRARGAKGGTQAHLLELVREEEAGPAPARVGSCQAPASRPPGWAPSICQERRMPEGAGFFSPCGEEVDDEGLVPGLNGDLELLPRQLVHLRGQGRVL